MHKRHRKYSFALIEVLVALALVGLMLPPLLSYVRASFRQSFHLQEEMICYEIAEEQLVSFLSEIMKGTYSFETFREGIHEHDKIGSFIVEKQAEEVQTDEPEEETNPSAMLIRVVVVVFPQGKDEPSTMKETKLCLRR